MGSKARWWPFAALFKSSSDAPAKNAPVRRAPSASTTSARAENAYHAVSIVPGPDACATAQQFRGLRFLSRQAPRLPLPTCDAAQCNCRFKHHKDRRAGPRRRGEQGLMPPHYQGTERRRRGGRRADDQ